VLNSTPSAAGGGELTEVSIGADVVEKYDSVEMVSSSSEGG